MADNATDILTLYHNEWIYRHENFWKRLTHFSVLIFFTTTLPITFRVFGDLALPKIPLLIFPLCGAFLTLLFLMFSLSENSRLIATSKTIDKIIKSTYGDKFVREDLTLFQSSKIDKSVQKLPFFRWRIGTLVPIVLSLMQLALAVFIATLILTNNLQ